MSANFDRLQLVQFRFFVFPFPACDSVLFVSHGRELTTADFSFGNNWCSVGVSKSEERRRPSSSTALKSHDNHTPQRGPSQRGQSLVFNEYDELLPLLLYLTEWFTQTFSWNVGAFQTARIAFANKPFELRTLCVHKGTLGQRPRLSGR